MIHGWAEYIVIIIIVGVVAFWLYGVIGCAEPISEEDHERILDIIDECDSHDGCRMLKHPSG